MAIAQPNLNFSREGKEELLRILSENSFELVSYNVTCDVNGTMCVDLSLKMYTQQASTLRTTTTKSMGETLIMLPSEGESLGETRIVSAFEDLKKED